MRRTPLCCAVFAACAGGGTTGAPSTPPREPVSIATSDTDRRINALEPARLGGGSKELDDAIESYYERAQTKRTYIMTDKPLYQPGETIWLRADLRATGTMLGGQASGMTLQLVSPRGSIAQQKRVLVREGIARTDFALASEIEGGEYSIVLVADDGTRETKKLVINTYETPRLQKTLEMLRKAYGEGDVVTAAIEIKQATGEAFGDRALTGVITIDDVELPRLAIRTDKDGKAMARFQLPPKLLRGDGLLTILVEDGGVTESIQKRIPIVMKTLQLGLYPEGGDLVDGIPGRVYFMAKTTLGKPADVSGKVLDEKGNAIAEFSSVRDGMGRFELTPETDRKYTVVIEKPTGITAKFAVPAAKQGGCVVRSVDQPKGDLLRVAAICNTTRKLVVEATMREKRIGGGTVDVTANKPTVVEMPVEAGAQGAVRITLFSARNEPLAERLVYHGIGSNLKIELTADKSKYTPRDPVKLRVKTTDAFGKPVKANVGIAVVDETVLSFADDKSARILARMYLEPELGATAEDPIEDPNFYFSGKPEAAAAMDALLATRGYRRFEWRPVIGKLGGDQ